MKDENVPAFPVKVKRNTSSDPLATPREIQFEGMSLRDWFAGQALAGYFAAPHTPHMNASSQQTAAYLYGIADALLAQREEKL